MRGSELSWDNEKKASVGRGGELELGFWKVCQMWVEREPNLVEKNLSK